MTHCDFGHLVDRHFEGAIEPEAERTMREHLPTCDSCGALYRRYLLLNRLDPEAAQPPEERIARGLGLRRGRWPRVAIPLVAIAAAAAVALTVLGLPRRAEEFTARGAITPPADQPSRVFVYDVGPGAPPAPVSDSLKSGHELAFAYVNGAAKRRLAIFGVDETRRVYWFFPAWRDESSDPVAIPVESDGLRHELPEAIRHHFVGAHLEIRSVFLDEPMSVRQIEALLKGETQAPLSIPGAVQGSLSLAVTP
jgi:hypothetical protein